MILMLLNNINGNYKAKFMFGRVCVSYFRTLTITFYRQIHTVDWLSHTRKSLNVKYSQWCVFMIVIADALMIILSYNLNPTV